MGLEPYQIINLIADDIKDLKLLIQNKINQSNISERILNKLEKGLGFIRKYKHNRDLESGFLTLWSIINETLLVFLEYNKSKNEITIKEDAKIINCSKFTGKNILINDKLLFIYKKVKEDSLFKKDIRNTTFQMQVYMIQSGYYTEQDQVLFAILVDHRNTLDMIHSKTNNMKYSELPLWKTKSIKYILAELYYTNYLVKFFKSIYSNSNVNVNFKLKDMTINDNNIVGIIKSKFIKNSQPNANNEIKTYYFFKLELLTTTDFKQEVKIEVSNLETFEVFEIGETIRAFINFRVNNEINNISAWKIFKIVT